MTLYDYCLLLAGMTDEKPEDLVKAKMDQSEQRTAGAFKVTWRPVTSSRIDTTALRKALPDIAARFTKTTTCRRFQVN